MKRNPRDLTIVRAAIATLIGIVALGVGTPEIARADLIQSVEIVYQDSSGLTLQRDEITAATGQIPSRDILAEINMGFARASATAGVFGDVALSGFFTMGERLSSRVRIDSSGENVNLSSLPRRAEAFFVIDGGSMSMSGGVGSFLHLDLQILFNIYKDDPLEPSRTIILFDPGLTLMETSGGRTFTTGGPDIGATVTRREVIIPLSFQRIDLGLVPPGANIDISYDLDVTGHVVDFVEGMGWAWSDPLDVSGTGAFPTIRFASAAVIAEPSSLALAALGMLGLLGYCRRPRHRARTCPEAA
jgi:hypothetical protein